LLKGTNELYQERQQKNNKISQLNTEIANYKKAKEQQEKEIKKAQSKITNLEAAKNG
jgi:predicted  nucleic acid-binding Zn-ribbon protein